MENYNQPYDQSQPLDRSIFNALEVDQNGKTNLAEAGKWAKFLGILGFVMLVLALLGSLAFIFMGSSLLENSPEMQSVPFSGGIFGIIYLIVALLYIYPTWALYKFGNLIRIGIKTDNQAKFSEGLAYLKGFFKFFGVLTIIIIAFYVLMIIAIAMGAGFGALGQ